MQSLTVELKMDEINLRSFSAFILQLIVVTVFSVKDVLQTISTLQAIRVIISPKPTENESFCDEVAFFSAPELPKGIVFYHTVQCSCKERYWLSAVIN